MRENLNAITEQHHLIDVFKFLFTQVFRRIGPTDNTRLGMGIRACHRQVLGSGNQGVIDIIGDKIRDNTLVIVEGPIKRVQSIDGIPSITTPVAASPTIIEVELAVAVTNATANESMASIALGTRIIERKTFFKTRDEQFFPIILGERITGIKCGMVSITEIIGDSSRNMLGECSRTIIGILHIHRHAAMVHQSGNCLNLSG